MAYMSYAQQLRHPNWQRRRLERLAVADFQCEDCGDGDNTLNVHHPRYFKGRKAWEYADDELQVLCETCHHDHHAADEVLQRILSSEEGPRVIGLVAGALNRELDPDDLEALKKVCDMGSYGVGLNILRRW